MTRQPPTLWILKVKPRSSALAAGAFTGPSHHLFTLFLISDHVFLFHSHLKLLLFVCLWNPPIKQVILKNRTCWKLRMHLGTTTAPQNVWKEEAWNAQSLAGERGEVRTLTYGANRRQGDAPSLEICLSAATRTKHIRVCVSTEARVLFRVALIMYTLNDTVKHPAIGEWIYQSCRLACGDEKEGITAWTKRWMSQT